MHTHFLTRWDYSLCKGGKSTNAKYYSHFKILRIIHGIMKMLGSIRQYVTNQVLRAKCKVGLFLFLEIELCLISFLYNTNFSMDC